MYRSIASVETITSHARRRRLLLRGSELSISPPSSSAPALEESDSDSFLTSSPSRRARDEPLTTTLREVSSPILFDDSPTSSPISPVEGLEGVHKMEEDTKNYQKQRNVIEPSPRRAKRRKSRLSDWKEANRSIPIIQRTITPWMAEYVSLSRSLEPQRSESHEQELTTKKWPEKERQWKQECVENNDSCSDEELNGSTYHVCASVKSLNNQISNQISESSQICFRKLKDELREKSSSL